MKSHITYDLSFTHIGIQKLTADFVLLNQDYWVLQGQLHIFLCHIADIIPQNADDISILQFFLLIRALRMMPPILRFFDTRSIISQSVVVCPSMVTITHAHTSITHCLEVWQDMPPDLSITCQVSCTVL